MKKILTLVFLLRDDHILLGYKKRGFGKDRWNGFGGKVEPGESLEQCAMREVLEESGLQIMHLEKRAIHQFSFNYYQDELEVHTYFSKEWSGEAKETEEMRPRWFSFKQIPYETMWPDDKLWLPQFLEGRYLKTNFCLGKADEILEYTVQIVESL